MTAKQEKSLLPKKEKRRFSASVRLLLFLLCLQFCQIATHVTKPLWGGIERADAITTPFGVWYFIDEPTDWLTQHEECHYERLQEIGALAFYSDYIFGGACEEEIRCGANPARHYACTDYPMTTLSEWTR